MASSSTSSIVESVLRVIQKSVVPLTDEDLVKLCRCDVNDIAAALNALVRSHRVRFRREGNVILYESVSDDDRRKLDRMSANERLVYLEIEKGGNRGVWIKDLRTYTKLPQPTLAKILKEMESKSLIKSITSIEQKNRKKYMLYHIEPSLDISGGVWYGDDGEFDTAFVEQLEQVILVRIASLNPPRATVTQLYEHINENGISTVTLSEKDVECLLQGLIYGGRIMEAVETSFPLGSGVRFYEMTSFGKALVENIYSGDESSTRPLDLFNNALVSVPCGTCPVVRKCHPDNEEVNPRSCEYLSKWLSDW